VSRCKAQVFRHSRVPALATRQCEYAANVTGFCPMHEFLEANGLVEVRQPDGEYYTVPKGEDGMPDVYRCTTCGRLDSLSDGKCSDCWRPI
jgi:hypothetical protein